MKILILCSDNSCLSQMAQGWLQSFDKSLTVCSAGISPAIEVHPLAVQTLASSGIDISHHKPEAVEEYIDEPWDYVITVSRDAEENCPAFTGKVRNLIHSNFYNPARAKGTPESIANEFRRISNQIKMKMYDLYCTKYKTADTDRLVPVARTGFADAISNLWSPSARYPVSAFKASKK